MRKPLDILKEESSILGNHNRKYLLAIDSYLDCLKARLEEKGKVDQVHFWHYATDPKSEMSTAFYVGRDEREKLNLLGCYYALQYLHMNLSFINVLKLVSSPNNLEIYKVFMKNIGNNFRSLTAAYMDNLLRIILPENERLEFFIASVGTRADQDDIDIGIVDNGSQNRKYLNCAIGRMAKEMMKFACSIHFHLSEHISESTYSASIPEYRTVLDKAIGDFIIISEILGAKRIIGSSELFDKFYKEISQRYFFRGNEHNKFNEGFIRGITGEVKSLIIRPLARKKINPKDDALRIIKGILSAKKTLFNIHETNNWDIIDKLKEKDNFRLSYYSELERALSFFEIFRYIYQLLVVQEEEIRINETGMLDNLATVARFLGYEDVGALRAPDHLLVHYYEYVKMVRRVIPGMIEDIEYHLRKNSIFVEIFSQVKEGSSIERAEKNLALRFMKNFRFFKGTTYWEDILDTLNSDRTLLKNYTSDLNSLTEQQKYSVIKRYIDWVKYDLHSLIKLIIMIAESGNENIPLFGLFNRMFLESMMKTSEITKRLTNIFLCYRKLIYDYLSILDNKSLEYFNSCLGDKFLDKELVKERQTLRYLTKLFKKTSTYFRRFMDRAVDIYPESIRHIQETHRLKEIARGILGEVKSLEGFKAKKKVLGEYYDIEFLRVGLETLEGASVEKTNAAFSEFCDNYINILVDICKCKIEEEYGEKVFTGDLLAIFAAGGHAREQAFNDDYDLIVILDSKDEKIRELSTRVIALMNTEITKRGTIPHYRFAEYFGNYVVLMKEICSLFKKEHESSFIEKSQVLGSRMVVGSEKFRKNFEKKVIHPYIFDKRDVYIKDMINEIHSRQEEAQKDTNLSNNIKEGVGGLRDIEMLILIYKAKYGIREPINARIFDTLIKLEPNHKKEIEFLRKGFNYLKNLRDVYRLTVAANDSIDFDSLDLRRKNLFRDFEKTRNGVYKTIKKLLKELS